MAEIESYMPTWQSKILNNLPRIPVWRNIYIYIYRVALSARISLTLSRHPSPSSIAFGRSSGLHLVSELLYVGSRWSSCLCSSMWRGPQEYITYELVPTSPAVSRMSGSSMQTIWMRNGNNNHLGRWYIDGVIVFSLTEVENCLSAKFKMLYPWH